MRSDSSPFETSGILQMQKFANYEYFEKIGQGTFGAIYKGRNVRTDETVVVKMEPFDLSAGFSSLKHESNMLNILYSKKCRNIPPTYWYGTISEPPRRVLVMPYYEEPLQSIQITSAKMAAKIMQSAILILQHIHEKYVVHRDIKPANFMIHNDELVLIDFGLATFYVDSNERHISNTAKKENIIGTPKYASWNIHCGEEYSRRDDLMSVVYIGLFLIYGDSLWNPPPQVSSSADKKDKSSLLHPLNRWFKTKKTSANIAELLTPWTELMTLARHIYVLSFQERPSYSEYIELFSKTI
jgi:serine/threonine protein kinase